MTGCGVPGAGHRASTTGVRSLVPERATRDVTLAVISASAYPTWHAVPGTRHPVPDASSPGIIEKPEIDDNGPGIGGDHWIVTVYDNDYNSIDQVILILMKATGCCRYEAEIETWEIHHLGKSVVHHGAEDDCTQVAAVIAQIGIRVEVSAE